MPAQYERIRDKFISQGMSEEEAKRRAAKIYNSKHPDDPVGPNYEERKRKMKKRRKPKVEYPRPK